MRLSRGPASLDSQMASHESRVYDSVLGLLCNVDNPTPLVRLNRVLPYQHTQVFAKLEWYNPFGAIKDRVAANLIAEAEKAGALGQVRKLVEPTSGNTGMGLAMMANAKGYKLSTTLSSAIPLVKKDVLRFFGVDVIEMSDDLCPAPGAPEGAIATALQMGNMPDMMMLNQYANANNPQAHYRTTGPEIWKQTDGKITHFVAGLGTCGTITGTGRFLKDQNKDVKVLGVAPAEGHDIPGVRSYTQLAQTDFYKPDEYDGTVEIDNEEAYNLTARLNREESIIAGPSSGMALAGALEMIEDEPGSIVVVIFPDNIFKYTASVRKHLPGMFPPMPEADGGSGKDDALVQQLLENVRKSPDVLDMGEMEDLLYSDEPPLLIDVRPKNEFLEQRVENAINIPLEELSGKAEGLPEDRTKPIVTVCNVGKISRTATLILKSMGYNNTKNLGGGLTAWIAEGLPTEQG